MQHRNSYSDLGLIIAVGVFICLLIKCLRFGFPWVSIIWLILSCVYFFISKRYSSESVVVKHATTAFLALSALAIVGILLFDKNARPAVRAFEGTGDTIRDERVVEEEPIVPIKIEEEVDTVEKDSAVMMEALIDTVSASHAGADLAPAADSVKRQ